MSDEGWEPVSAITPTWDKFQQAELVGVYTQKKEGVGQNKSTIHVIQDAKGKSWSAWGNGVLDNKMAGVAFGEEVKIVFLGKEKSPKTGRMFSNYDVFHRPAPMEKV